MTRHHNQDDTRHRNPNEVVELNANLSNMGKGIDKLVSLAEQANVMRGHHGDKLDHLAGLDKHYGDAAERDAKYISDKMDYFVARHASEHALLSSNLEAMKRSVDITNQLLASKFDALKSSTDTTNYLLERMLDAIKQMTPTPRDPSRSRSMGL